MAGVMVVYGPPITHLPPPAVGASPDAAIHDFKGSCRRSVPIAVGRSLPRAVAVSLKRVMRKVNTGSQCSTLSSVVQRLHGSPGRFKGVQRTREQTRTVGRPSEPGRCLHVY